MNGERQRRQEIAVNEAEQTELQSLSRSRAQLAALVRTRRVVLMSAEGHGNSAISQSLDTTTPTVGARRRRCPQRGIAGHYGEKPWGCPGSRADEQVGKLMPRALSPRLKDGTH